MDEEEFYMKFFGTPPEHLVWGLREALDMLFEEGLEATFARHRRLAAAVQAASGCGGGRVRWSSTPSIRPNGPPR